MFCSKCGKELNEGMKYCGNCGAKILFNTDASSMNIKKKRFFSCIIVIGILLIIGIIAFCIKASKKKEVKENLSDSITRDLVQSEMQLNDISDYIGDNYDDYDENVSPFGLKFISENGLYGFCNVQGETVVPCIYDNIYFLNIYNETTKGIWIVERGGKKGALDVYGNVILDTIYRDIDIMDEFVYTFFSRDDKAHANLFDLYGNPILGNDVDASDIKIHKDVRRITAQIGPYVSLFDYEGNMIFNGETIKCNGISPFRFGVAGVSTDTIYCGIFRNHYYIDSDGNILTQAYGAASEFNGLGQAVVNIGAKDYNEQTYLIDKKFNIICNLSEYGINYRRSFQYKSLSLFHNGFIEQDGKLISLSDFQEYDYEIVERACFLNNDYSELLIVKNRLNNLYGLILDGEIIYPTQYDDYYLEREENDVIAVLYPTYPVIELQYGDKWETIYIFEDMLINVS